MSEESGTPKAQLAAAFVAAQGEFKSALKESSNPFFKSKYADLTSIWEACSGALKKHRLAVSQAPGQLLKDPTRLELKTTIMHASGAEMWSVMEIPLVKIDPQAMGSALSYARRYSLAALLGIVVDDDDANKATRDRHKSQPHEETETISKEEAKSLAALAVEMGWTEIERQNLLVDFGLDTIMDLPVDQVKKFEAHLRGDK